MLTGSKLRVRAQAVRLPAQFGDPAEKQSLDLPMRYKGGLVTYLGVISAQSIDLQDEYTDVDILRRRMGHVQAIGDVEPVPVPSGRVCASSIRTRCVARR
jgi:hypothetical protein